MARHGREPGEQVGDLERFGRQLGATKGVETIELDDGGRFRLDLGKVALSAYAVRDAENSLGIWQRLVAVVVLPGYEEEPHGLIEVVNRNGNRNCGLITRLSQEGRFAGIVTALPPGVLQVVRRKDEGWQTAFGLSVPGPLSDRSEYIEVQHKGSGTVRIMGGYSGDFGAVHSINPGVWAAPFGLALEHCFPVDQVSTDVYA